MKNFLLLFAILFFGCGNENKKKKTIIPEKVKVSNDFHLMVYDTLMVPIDSATSTLNKIYNVYQNGLSSYLVLFNKLENALQVYNLEDKSFERKIDLNSLLNKFDFQAIYVHSFDSIFMLGYSKNEIYLTDTALSKFKIFNVGKLNGLEDNYELYSDFFNFHYDPESSNVKFYVLPFIEGNTKEYYNSNLAVDYNIKLKKVSNFYSSYPSSYKNDKCYYLLEYLGNIPNSEQDIFYFMADHNIYFYNKYSKKLEKVLRVKSPELPENIESIIKFGESNPMLQEQRNYYITTGYYENVLVNEKEKVYYRFVKEPMPLKQKNGNQTIYEQYKWSIMILDYDFNIIGNQKIEGGAFDMRVKFVLEGNLYLSLNNSENPINNENNLLFAKLKLKK